MASTCPNCGKKLRIWDIKAECSACGVSIPNYNWQERLEEDNIRAEKQFTVFYRTMNRIAYSIWGTKLRIVRLVLTFLPAVGFILPWAVIKSGGESFDLSIISFSGNKSLIDFFSAFFGNIKLFFTNMGFEKYSGAVTLGVAAYLLFALSALFIVIAFFITLIKCKNPKTKLTVVFDIISIVFSAASLICFLQAGAAASDATAVNFGSFSVIGASVSISWGYFVSLALLITAAVINYAVAKAPVKSDETLEQERLARKAVKDEKERQKEIEKEKSREEAKKKADAEQAEIVKKAKERLEAKKAKENKKK